MLEVSNLVKRFYAQEKPALDGVSFSVSPGETILVSGANGSGKSVLMKLVAGLDKSDGGTVSLTENTRVGLVFQDTDAQILADTVLEDTLLGPRNLGMGKKEALERARYCLNLMGLGGKEDLPCRSLSGGEKRRLAVAGILAMDASLILMDEPFANMDWPGVMQVTRIIETLQKEGKTLIILTHELEKVLALTDRLLVLHGGTIVWDSSPQDALDRAPLHEWGIRHPLVSYTRREDLVWKAGTGAEDRS